MHVCIRFLAITGARPFNNIHLAVPHQFLPPSHSASPPTGKRNSQAQMLESSLVAGAARTISPHYLNFRINDLAVPALTHQICTSRQLTQLTHEAFLTRGHSHRTIYRSRVEAGDLSAGSRADSRAPAGSALKHNRWENAHGTIPALLCIHSVGPPVHFFAPLRT